MLDHSASQHPQHPQHPGCIPSHPLASGQKGAVASAPNTGTGSSQYPRSRACFLQLWGGVEISLGADVSCTPAQCSPCILPLLVNDTRFQSCHPQAPGQQWSPQWFQKMLGVSRFIPPDSGDYCQGERKVHLHGGQGSCDHILLCVYLSLMCGDLRLACQREGGREGGSPAPPRPLASQLGARLLLDFTGTNPFKK